MKLMSLAIQVALVGLLFSTPLYAQGEAGNQDQQAAGTKAETTPATLPPAEATSSPPAPQAKKATKGAPARFWRDHSLERPLVVSLPVGFTAMSSAQSSDGVGLHLGYQMSQDFYLGATALAFSNQNTSHRRYHRYDDDDERVYGQRGAQSSHSRMGPAQLVELRWRPFPVGVYGSLGALHLGEGQVETTWSKKTRTLGASEVKTGLKATLDYEAITRPSLGVGFQHVFAVGLTVGMAMHMGLGARQRPEITLLIIDPDSAIAAADLEDWKDEIEDNESRWPMLVGFQVGYAF